MTGQTKTNRLFDIYREVEDIERRLYKFINEEMNGDWKSTVSAERAREGLSTAYVHLEDAHGMLQHEEIEK